MSGFRLRTAVKEVAYGLARAVGVPALGRRRRAGGLVVLTYHSFGPAEEHPYLHRMPVERLKRQLDHLRRHYEIVALETALDRMRREDQAPASRPMVAITVDDGYSDNLEHLLPALRATGVPATIFPATDYLDTGRLPWPTRLSAMLHHATRSALYEPVQLPLTTAAERITAGAALRGELSRLGHASREERLEQLKRDLAPRKFDALRPLTWDEVRRMRIAGITFGSHTHHHGWLDRLELAEVELELGLSRQRLEAETGEPCRLLAYPNGNWNAAVAATVERAGYAYALSQDNGVNEPRTLRSHALYRVEVPWDERVGTFACRIAGVAR